MTPVSDVGWAKRRRRVPTINDSGGHGASRLSPPYDPPARGMTRRNVWLALFLALCFATTALATEIAPAERRSGTAFMSRETQAMQADDRANPGMLAVIEGEALWKQSCAGCHGDAAAAMKGVAARYPAFDKALARPVNLEQRINLCRARHQEAEPLPYEKHDLLALSAFVAEQSRGMAITPDTAPEIEPFVAKGRDFFIRRQGQFNLGCTNCHDDNWDKHLAGSAVTQAIPNGYPIYRLEWQSLGSLQRRLRNCITGMRAQNFDFGAPELVELELYLMVRARGMPVETPAVRP
jgi:sulfur-oxidizing protein SoxA